MLSILKNLFVGELREHGETLVCAAAPPAALPVSRLIADRILLRDILQQHACALHMRDGDMRPVASDWSLRYLWALLPPLVAATSVMRHHLPAAADEIAVLLDHRGAPQRFYIEHEGYPLLDGETLSRYKPLLEHLALLFATLSALTRLPKKVMWGNAARYLELVFDQALLLTQGEPAVIADKMLLLDSPTLPDQSRNPLYAPRRSVTRFYDGDAVTLTLHPQCCLAHLLPGEEYCGGCPLALQSCDFNEAAPIS
jgi:ferric iron reductase protein FhuF